MKPAFAFVAAVLAIAGNVPYLAGVLRGKIRPHAYTWFLWSLVSAIVLFGQIAKGAGVGAVPTAASEIFTFGIFLLSLKYGYTKVTKGDTSFLLIALAGIVPWISTDDPTISVVVAVGIDVIAFVPTLRKTRLEPATEQPLLYGTNVVRHIFALVSLQAYNIATMLHSIAMITTNLVMVSLIAVAAFAAQHDGRGKQRAE